MAPSETAVDEIRQVVGADHVIADPAVLHEYESATFATTQRIPLVVLPGSVEEIQRVLELANRHQLPFYPTSRGRNWGLGSRVPVQDGSCVLDLKRMNRILDFSEEQAHITVEPGVTFQQVADYLAEKKSNLYLSAIGGPPDSSVLANALERGDGAGPLGDRARYCCGLEAVLPTGERVSTGLSALDGSLCGKLALFGLGPAVEGLFFQSNLAIVTRLTVLLARRPPHFQCAGFTVRSEAELIQASAAIRELQQLGVLTDTAYSLINIYRLLSLQARYPWDGEGNPLPSPEQLLEQLPAVLAGVRWAGFIGLYGASPGHARAQRRLLKAALKGKVTKLIVVDSVTAAIASKLRAPLSLLTDVDVEDILHKIYYGSVFLGHPTKLEGFSTYWRKRGPLPETCNPDRDGCGLHWICVALPFDGAHIARTTRIVEEVALAHRLEPMCMYFNMSQWYLKSFIVILFDRDVPEEARAARSCHDEALARLIEAGYSPVRLGIQSMTAIVPDQSHVELLRRLKRLLDPNDILAPGRYDFRHRWGATLR